MLTTHFSLKQLLISITIFTISSLCLQVQANDNPGFADYRLQKVATNPDKQAFPTQQLSTQKQSKDSAVIIPEAVSTTTISGTDTNWPLVLLTPIVLGFVIFLVPSWFSRNKTIADADAVDQDSDKAIDTINTENVADVEDSYLASIEAEAELEERLDAEEELDSIDRKTLGRIGTRDRKHNNRVATKRKR